jgi:hypothetical protein
MPTSRSPDPIDSGTGFYHIVCHDCPTEFLARGESEARTQCSEHESSTGHNVEFASLDAIEV